MVGVLHPGVRQGTTFQRRGRSTTELTHCKATPNQLAVGGDNGAPTDIKVQTTNRLQQPHKLGKAQKCYGMQRDPMCAYNNRIMNTPQVLTQGIKPSNMSAGKLSMTGTTLKFSPSHTALDSRSVLAGSGLSH